MGFRFEESVAYNLFFRVSFYELNGEMFQRVEKVLVKSMFRVDPDDFDYWFRETFAIAD